MKISHQPTWVGARQKAYPKLRVDVTTDVAIVGGGLTGLLTAYLLSKTGKKVAVLEAGTLGSGATAYTTAFITQVIDTSLGDLIRMVGPQKAESIWQAGEQAIDRIETIVKKEKIDCEFQRCSARVYASSEKDYKKLENEHRAAERLGFATKLVSNRTLPFEQYGLLEVKDQAKFHPLKFLRGVADIVVTSGGQIFEHSKALSLKEGPGGATTVKTSRRKRHGERCDRGHLCALQQTRDGEIHKRICTAVMFLRYDFQKEYLRKDFIGTLRAPIIISASTAGEQFDRMILGGEDHRSELRVSPKKKFDALEKYLVDLLGGRSYQIVRKWIGAVLEPVGGLPLIGAYKPHQFVATAFSGNGMTYAMVSALIFRDLILGKRNPWTHVFDRNLPPRKNTSNPRRKRRSSWKK